MDKSELNLSERIKKLISARQYFLQNCSSGENVVYSDDAKESEYCVITPPIETYLSLPDEFLKKHFFSTIQKCDIISGAVSGIQESGIVIAIETLECGLSRNIYNLGIMGFCPIRDVPKINRDNPLNNFQLREKVRGVITGIENGRLMLSFMQHHLSKDCLHIKLGSIESKDFPEHHKVLVNLDNRHFEDFLTESAHFNNLGGVEFLCNKMSIDMKKQYSLLHCVNDITIKQEDCADNLRKQQLAEISLKSVANGVSFFKCGKYQDALMSYDEALRLHSENVEAYVARGALYATRGTYSNALSDMEQALKLCPTHKNAANYLVQILMADARNLSSSVPTPASSSCDAASTDALAEAEKHYKRVLSLQPNHEDALLALRTLRSKMMPPMSNRRSDDDRSSQLSGSTQHQKTKERHQTASSSGDARVKEKFSERVPSPLQLATNTLKRLIEKDEEESMMRYKSREESPSPTRKQYKDPPLNERRVQQRSDSHSPEPPPVQRGRRNQLSQQYYDASPTSSSTAWDRSDAYRRSAHMEHSEEAHRPVPPQQYNQSYKDTGPKPETHKASRRRRSSNSSSSSSSSSSGSSSDSSSSSSQRDTKPMKTFQNPAAYTKPRGHSPEREPTSGSWRPIDDESREDKWRRNYKVENNSSLRRADYSRSIESTKMYHRDSSPRSSVASHRRVNEVDPILGLDLDIEGILANTLETGQPSLERYMPGERSGTCGRDAREYNEEFDDHSAQSQRLSKLDHQRNNLEQRATQFTDSRHCREAEFSQRTYHEAPLPTRECREDRRNERENFPSASRDRTLYVLPDINPSPSPPPTSSSRVYDYGSAGGRRREISPKLANCLEDDKRFLQRQSHQGRSPESPGIKRSRQQNMPEASVGKWRSLSSPQRSSVSQVDLSECVGYDKDHKSREVNSRHQEAEIAPTPPRQYRDSDLSQSSRQYREADNSRQYRDVESQNLPRQYKDVDLSHNRHYRDAEVTQTQLRQQQRESLQVQPPNQYSDDEPSPVQKQYREAQPPPIPKQYRETEPPPIPKQYRETEPPPIPKQYRETELPPIPKQYRDTELPPIPKQYREAQPPPIPKQYRETAPPLIPKQYREAQPSPIPKQYREAEQLPIRKQYRETEPPPIPKQYRETEPPPIPKQYREAQPQPIPRQYRETEQPPIPKQYRGAELSPIHQQYRDVELPPPPKKYREAEPSPPPKKYRDAEILPPKPYLETEIVPPKQYRETESYTLLKKYRDVEVQPLSKQRRDTEYQTPPKQNRESEPCPSRDMESLPNEHRQQRSNEYDDRIRQRDYDSRRDYVSSQSMSSSANLVQDTRNGRNATSPLPREKVRKEVAHDDNDGDRQRRESEYKKRKNDEAFKNELENWIDMFGDLDSGDGATGAVRDDECNETRRVVMTRGERDAAANLKCSTLGATNFVEFENIIIRKSAPTDSNASRKQLNINWTSEQSRELLEETERKAAREKEERSRRQAAATLASSPEPQTLPNLSKLTTVDSPPRGRLYAPTPPSKPSAADIEAKVQAIERRHKDTGESEQRGDGQRGRGGWRGAGWRGSRGDYDGWRGGGQSEWRRSSWNRGGGSRRRSRSRDNSRSRSYSGSRSRSRSGPERRERSRSRSRRSSRTPSWSPPRHGGYRGRGGPYGPRPPWRGGRGGYRGRPVPYSSRDRSGYTSRRGRLWFLDDDRRPRRRHRSGSRSRSASRSRSYDSRSRSDSYSRSRSRSGSNSPARRNNRRRSREKASSNQHDSNPNKSHRENKRDESNKSDSKVVEDSIDVLTKVKNDDNVGSEIASVRLQSKVESGFVYENIVPNKATIPQSIAEDSTTLEDLEDFLVTLKKKKEQQQQQ